jgi:hypothetical protein
VADGFEFVAEGAFGVGGVFAIEEGEPGIGGEVLAVFGIEGPEVDFEKAVRE